ncbi:MAG: hypothetical protein EOP09_04105 [Proteobacteria bacterium]|nr:MAG: hypothetical protein EOP09_04105 [Pseudomonadota bacterium]
MSIVRPVTAFFSLVALIVLASCATMPYQPYAREVKRQPLTSGIIALKETHQAEDRSKADQLMSANCGSKLVKVLDEGEIATGTATTANQKKTNDQERQGGMQWGAFTFGGEDKNAENTAVNSTTTTLKEWRINYECVAAAAPTSAPLTSGRKTAKK